MSIYERRTVCPYDCPDSCGMIVTTDGKQIFSVRGDEKHPVTKGFLCRKMQHYEQDIHSPHRILTPLKRIGEKGRKESFVPVSWEEAISGIGVKWRQIISENGADSILPYSYAGTMGVIQRNCGEAFFARLGAAHLKRTICSDAKSAGISRVMGEHHDWNSSHIKEADLIVLWSSNPMVNRIHVVPQIQEAKKHGAQVILIDVWNNNSASLCDDVLLLKPGTDAALLLAIMAELDRNRLLDSDFIENHTTGFEELRSEFSGWTCERASTITGIPAEKIRSFANLFGNAKKPLLIAGSGMSRYTNGAAATQLLMNLPALTGAWAKGGGTSSLMGSSAFLKKDFIKRPDWLVKDLDPVNMNQLGDRLTSQKIKSLYVYHSNPAVMTPDQQKVLQGLQREDLFLVVHDRFLTDTALYADFVLPAALSVEQDDFFTSYGHYHMQASRMVIPPAGEAKSNWDTFCLLAKEMGFEDDYFKYSAKEIVDLLLRCPDETLEHKKLEPLFTEHPFTCSVTESQFEQLRNGCAILVPQPDVKDFCTGDGRIHLNPDGASYTPLKDQKYPLRLVMVHSVWSLNSNFSYREELMEKRGPLTLRMHPLDAKSRHISDGELCYAYNDHGIITVQISLTEDFLPGTVIAEGVYQKEHTFGDGNFSSLLSQTLTDAGEASTLNSQTVEIRKK